MIQTAKEIKHIVLTLALNGEGLKIESELVKWGITIVDECVMWLNNDAEDEIVNEIKDQL